jgi:hypothetical protein
MEVVDMVRNKETTKLTEKVKQWDLDYVKRWPKDFQEANIEVYKL